MIGSTRSLRVYAWTLPTDMRKGFDGLYGMVASHLERDPLCGDLFLFVSRNRKRAKVLLWDGTGLRLYAFPGTTYHIVQLIGFPVRRITSCTPAPVASGTIQRCDTWDRGRTARAGSGRSGLRRWHLEAVLTAQLPQILGPVTEFALDSQTSKTQIV